MWLSLIHALVITRVWRILGIPVHFMQVKSNTKSVMVLWCGIPTWVVGDKCELSLLLFGNGKKCYSFDIHSIKIHVLSHLKTAVFQAQNIKNFKSQRWQTLLNFNSLRRLLLTGTPLQNSLMELWSLMHFLMPQVFQSHREFKEWFANPLTGMIEGSHEYNEKLIHRLHKVGIWRFYRK